MKKFVTLATVLVTVLVASTAFAAPVYARGWGGGCCRGWGAVPSAQGTAVPQAQYFNADGTQVTFQPSNLWQDSAGNVMFGRGCWYYDANGNVVNAWNSQVFDADGNPVIWGGYGWGACCVAYWG